MAVLLLMATMESASATGWSSIDDGGYSPSSNLGARKLLQFCLPKRSFCSTLFYTTPCCNGPCFDFTCP
ncbi:hypothetical protein SEVIR_8G079250v4 [Setaria viridis]|uniref:Uncharacterized protein n=2 Tax=Setaria TaxID=4554 RepID=K3ZPM3_SETIT|nr:hypothetical protein SEVIR_8G079250v2 [Setaria viridis]